MSELCIFQTLSSLIETKTERQTRKHWGILSVRYVILQNVKLDQTHLWYSEPWSMQHSILLLSDVLHSTVLYCTVLHSTALYYSVLYYTARHSTALYCPAQHCTLLYCIAQHSNLLYCTTLYFIVWHSTALYCTAQHGTVMYCTSQHYTVQCNWVESDAATVRFLPRQLSITQA